MLKLVDVLAIKSPERERLVEADDAIRDLVRLLEAATEPEGRWAGSQGVALCIAVAEAGGLGSMPAAMLTPAVLHEQIGAVRASTRAPINVNFFCHAPPAPDPERGLWREAVVALAALPSALRP
jgi:hypothetical protein